MVPHAPSNVPSRKVEKRTYAKCQEDVERLTCDCRCRFWPVCPRLPQKFEPPLTSPPNGTLESQTLKMWRKLVGPFSRLELRKKIFKLRPSKSNLGPLFFDSSSQAGAIYVVAKFEENRTCWFRELVSDLQQVFAPVQLTGSFTWNKPSPDFIIGITDLYSANCASTVLAVIVSVWVSDRLSVCLSVTGRSCTKMAKPRITLTTPYNSPGTLVFWRQTSRRNSNYITPNGDTE